MNYTGVTSINSAINLVSSHFTRWGSSFYTPIAGTKVSQLGASRIITENGFINNEPVFGLTHPEVKIQSIEINLDGSSPIIYNNKKGISNNYIQRNTGNTHWYTEGNWQNELKCGSSQSAKTFRLDSVCGASQAIIVW